jgi:hypothetical protein
MPGIRLTLESQCLAGPVLSVSMLDLHLSPSGLHRNQPVQRSQSIAGPSFGGWYLHFLAKTGRVHLFRSLRILLGSPRVVCQTPEEARQDVV